MTIDEVELINLTPHPVSLHLSDGTAVTVAAQPTSARVELQRISAGQLSTSVGTIALTTTLLSSTIIGLPLPRPRVVLCVSRVVAEAVTHRKDLVFPDDLVRDAEGRVIGARSLGRVCRGE